MDRDCNNEHQRADDPRQYERFVSLFAQAHDNILAYIFSLLPRWSDAEDVFQQTSLVLWRKFGDFQPDSDFIAWACRVAFFEVQNFRRTAGRDRLTFDNELVERLAEERDVSPKRTADRRNFLMECIEKLPEKQRNLLGDAYQEETTIRQLAERLNRSPQTIYNRLNQIRHTLFECVEDAVRRQRAE